MTVQTELRRVVQTGNGATSTFYFNAPVLGLDDLDVYTVTTAAVQTLQTRGGAGTFDYTMTINASTKYATVTLNNNLTNGFKIVMLRSTAITQGVDYVEGDPFLAETHEGALDRLTLIATQLQEQIDRSVKVVETSTTTGITVQELSANAVLVVNAGATGFEMGPTPSSITASATAAAASASAAASSASAASTSASNASTSASNASTSAGSASTSATSATASASSATSSATSATSSASAASTSATNAAASASTATTQATNAATSASGASTSATNAAASAATATTQATNAATSATGSANSATSAAASAASAAALLDNFDDRYLGAKASDPALDNDGNALVTGALYFNTTDGVMKVYTASGWIAASSASVATLATFEFVATAGQTVFTGADANSATLSYVAPALIVTLNGVRLRPGDDYTATNGTSITLISAAALNDELVVDAFGSFLVANTYTIAQTDAGFVAKTSSTGAATMPVGTTGQRPGTPATGMFRMNSTTGNPEWYDAVNSVWTIFGQPATYSVDYLVVAGGGAGGSVVSGNYCSGAGGAGGYLATTGTIIPNVGYTITVGAGGPAGGPGQIQGNNGSNSAISGTGISATSIGGGGGAAGGGATSINGSSGGSGGGGSRSTGVGGAGTAGQGFAGGAGNDGANEYGGGGGGGANALGSGGSSVAGGAGGAGLNWQSLGTFYAGGGGGGGYTGGTGGAAGNGGGGAGGSNSTGSNGSINTGGGAGGTGSGSTNFSGGGGGSGIVIIRYSGSQRGTGGTYSSSGGYSYHTFTSSGTYTA